MTTTTHASTSEALNYTGGELLRADNAGPLYPTGSRRWHLYDGSHWVCFPWHVEPASGEPFKVYKLERIS